ncbi:GDSL-type esterase/lipase family protein [Blastopirellula sp. JC732]|uniref:GDSL-type esterase/lipase family protein n=1 Tax=Blastopirellula sediminis TaxID=2894196 RepID=A0A9X1MLR2_9BACT|nr:GDSL-type esterase/lipase family protein [Blastopirellula sediminis]MCC9607334.1 GDSL-type esterase/lipase family protein [Blastopirellula sediminis]MCC9629373.1 GDSL-type esterase/lipase family protein [Blastopirellula sediminis]
MVRFARNIVFSLFVASLFATTCRADDNPLPRLVLIGDSTVKNGSGKGDGGLFGWGQVIAPHFDTKRIEIENRALGGRSSRTYLTEGLWEKSLARLRGGDFVMMQFGHNDSGEMFKGDRPRASIKGNGDESVDGVVEATGKQETVHSYGWYLRKYIADAKAKGAIPIVLSPVPRDRWEKGRVIRADKDYGLWAREAAQQAGAHFLDLNELVAARYEQLGEAKVDADLFTKEDWTHTTKPGAVINAACVVEGIQGLQDCSLKDFLTDAKVSRSGDANSTPRTLLAFPTAEGYGRFAQGGRSGRVLHVTNLNDHGPGTLREAVEAEGPRTVIFDISGLITLESPLVVRNPYLTIAGQTAPAKGICLRKYNFGLYGTHDVIIRHLRVRPGDISGQTLDGMGMAYSDHCIIDHCSISWTIDEAFSSRGAKNITLQRTLISEALNAAGHRKYPPGTQHGYAASIGGMIGSFHHNLLADCAGRNWSLAGGLDKAKRHTGWLDLRNNVVFNWKDRATDGGAARVQFVNNYYKPGPATQKFFAIRPELEWVHLYGPQQYFIAGNVLPGHAEAGDPLAGFYPWPKTPLEDYVVDHPFFEPHVRTQSAAEAYESVLADVGCNRPQPDQHDARIIQEVITGECRYRGSQTDLPGLPDSQADVGGWEDYPVVRRGADWDTDQDGMPDAWEQANQLDPQNAADGNLDRDADGYTNLEAYLASTAGE